MDQSGELFDPKKLIRGLQSLHLEEFRDRQDLKRSLQNAFEYRVMGHIIVRNLTKWTLTNPQLFIKRGRVTHQPQNIEPGSQIQIITTKDDWWVRGCVGWIAWDIKSYQAMVMWNIPFDHEANKLAVGLKDMTSQRTSTWNYESVYKKPHRDNNLCMEESSSVIPSYQNGPLYIQGTMTPNQHSEIEITICPMRREDIAENLREKLRGV